jgi:heme exporter protein B
MLVMSGLSLLLFTLLLGNPVEKFFTFIGLVFLGGWGLSLVFSFLAAIAAKAQQNAAIMAILGFPLIIPQLIMLMKISNSVFSQSGPAIGITVLLLIAMNILIIILSIILFPFLWKD